MPTNCAFCEIASGAIKARIVLENDEVVAFRDIAPQAPTHILVVPKNHVATLNDLTVDDTAVVGRMILVAKTIAKQEGIAESGYRLVMNCNADGHQTIGHIHLHLLGGRAMQWPPG